MKRYLAVALGLLLLAAPRAFAQISTGNIYGTVSDAQGGVLPGVSVTLSGDLGTRTAVTSSQGEFRFLALDTGRYRLTLTLAGFAETVREVVVTAGENVNPSGKVPQKTHRRTRGANPAGGKGEKVR